LWRAKLAPQNRWKPSKNAFDIGRSEAGSDALIARRQPPFGSEAIFEFDRKSIADI
jgi:hypothetical protein